MESGASAPTGAALEVEALREELRHLRRELALQQRQDGVLLASQRRLLELIAAGADLSETLDQLARAVETRAGGDMICSVLIVDADRRHLRHGAGPSLPTSYVAAIDGAPIGPSAGSCGTAAHRNARVVVADIETDPLWADYKGLALGAGLRACWSTPIRSGDGQVMGTFAVYYRAARAPDEDDLRLIDSVAHLAAIAIEQDRAERERLHLEAQLQHAQKLESLGVLAGGIAHDFNNLLVSILGQAGLARRRLAPDAPAAENVAGIEAAARRASQLTNQLLAYAGKGKFVVGPVDLTRLVEETAALLTTFVSKRAALRFELARDLPAVEGDATQLRQVAMNLFTNASDALLGGAGEITARTGVIDADRATLARCRAGQDLPPGRYAFMEVEDTGAGMSPETLARIFEPFFTTKATGRGLGLAAVTGILRGHRGAACVTSTPGRGTRFRVLFPALAVSAAAEAPPAAPAGGSGERTVLIVDDEAPVRRTLRLMLEDEGFLVLDAEGGREALARLQESGDRVSCVLLDLTMPDMTGAETLERIRALRGDVPVIVTSGFAAADVIARFESRRPDGFLQKPFGFDDLMAALAAVFQGRPGA